MNNRSQKRPTIEELNQRIKNLENLNVEETLETLDKGSPKLNWIYIILAMIGIFILVWVALTLSPNNDNPEEYPEINGEKIEQLEKKVDRLEKRVDELEES